jgi:hypothetical protein
MEPGQKIKYLPTGKIFVIDKVTDKRYSWYVGFVFKQGNGKADYRKTWVSIKTFNDGLISGVYELINE